MSIIDTFTTLFAPDDCLVCEREGALLCNECIAMLPALTGKCFQCHGTVKGAVCSDCLAAAPLTSLMAVANYSEQAKQLVAQLKFHGNQSAAQLIAKAMLQVCAVPPDALLTYVPATAAHIRQRGYDQAALIARHIARLTGCSTAPLLARSGNQHQLGADRQTRQQQLSESLRVSKPARLKDRHILLIDDVLTTGSSLLACANLLKASGAGRINALVFAQSVR